MNRIDLDILEKFKRGEFDYNNSKNFNQKEYFRRYNSLFTQYVNENIKQDPFRDHTIISYLLNETGYSYLLELRRLYH